MSALRITIPESLCCRAMEFKLQLASRTLKRELLKSTQLQIRRGPRILASD